MNLDLEPLLRIEVYTHFFKVIKFTPRILGILFKFSNRFTHHSFIQRQQGSNSPDPKTYTIKTKDDREFRFHIGQLRPFLDYLRTEYIDESFYTIENIPLYSPQKAKMALRPSYVLRDYQEKAKAFVLDNDVTDFHTRLVTIATGLGKGVISLAAVAQIGERVLVVVLPKYAEKWAIEIVEKLNVTPKDVMIIQGSKELKGIIQAGKENNAAVVKFTIISLTTLQNFFKAYEENRYGVAFEDYGCSPEELCSVLKIGSVIIDEVHEHLYGVFRFMCFTHVPKMVTLSGTVISGDPFIENIHKLMFPKEIRFDDIKMKKYIKVYPISYVFRDLQGSRIRTTEHGSRNYSQVAFEKSLMRNPQILNNYMRLTAELLDIGYIKDFHKGDKAAVYAGSVAMCTLLHEYLKRKYPHLDVRRFCEQDPYSNVIDSDIRITTIISAGTAIDIPQLTCVVMTNNVNSPVANLQTLGRLREIPGRDVRFLYIYCTEIQKQIDYHRARILLYQDRVASIKEFKSPIAL